MATPKSSDFNLGSLRSQIESSIIKSALDHDDKFLPEGILKRLIVPENLKLELQNLPLESVNFICDHAKKTFAILLLVCSGNIVPVIESFAKHKFTDNFLPIDLNTDMDNCEVESKRKCTHGEALNVFHYQPWTQMRIRIFCSKQWIFLAPVFGKEQNTYDFRQESPLPFICTDIFSTHFISTQKIEIHEDYQKIFPLMGGKQPHFALKRVQDDDLSQFRVLDCRASVAQISTLNHPHVQKSITITKNGRLYILSHWADGGTLEEFWQEIGSPTLDHELILDLLQQLLGLADAVCALHEDHIKYGNIKPNKIFRLKNNNKIGDIQIAGSSRRPRHYYTTRNLSDVQISLERYAFEHYLAPEFFTTGPVGSPQDEDLWSMGCLILEFIIWLLYGYVELRKFRDEASANDRSRIGKEQMNAINRWVNWIYRDPECKKATALGDLLHFVDKKLLIALPAWEEVKRLEHKKTKGLAGLHLFNKKPLVTSPTTEEEIRDPGSVPTFLIDDVDSTSTVDTEIQYRASAKQLRQEIDRIIQKAANNSKYLSTGAARGKIQGPEPLDTSKHTHNSSHSSLSRSALKERKNRK